MQQLARKGDPLAFLLFPDNVGVSARVRLRCSRSDWWHSLRQLLFARRDKGGHVRKRRAGGFISCECSLPRFNVGVLERQGTDKERQGPAVVLGQAGKRRHRRAVDTLADHLVKGHERTGASPFLICKGDRLRVERCRKSAVASAVRAVA